MGHKFQCPEWDYPATPFSHQKSVNMWQKIQCQSVNIIYKSDIVGHQKFVDIGEKNNSMSRMHPSGKGQR